MSELPRVSPERLSTCLRETENHVEERIREKALAMTLFHDTHLDDAIARSPEEVFQRISDELNFLDAKHSLNMGERFALALEPEHLGKIHVVELGHTTDPSATGEIDGLKTDYRHLYQWLNDHGIIKEGEIPRENKDSRSLTTREPVDDSAAESHVIIVRNRRLIRETMNHDGKDIRIQIGKRMVFAVPKGAAFALISRAEREKMSTSDAVNLFEETFIDKGTGGVIPIRTSYLLATDLL